MRGFKAMAPHLKEQLAEQRITFQFNPPSAPHFGGTWEREVKSLKTAPKVILKEQIVTESVLCTVLTEIEGILNAKPLGNISSNVTDPDPVTLSLLLMGRYDVSLPQVLYVSSNILGKHRWRHSQVFADHFWSQFVRYFLPSLQERQVEEGWKGTYCGSSGSHRGPSAPSSFLACWEGFPRS